jgi:hypothetical protein
MMFFDLYDRVKLQENIISVRDDGDDGMEVGVTTNHPTIFE